MRAVIQRVTHASVTVDHVQIANIGSGLLVLVGVEESDGQEDLAWLAKKIINLRVFSDEEGVMNRSVKETQGELLVVSQFTLMASYKKGNRPSWLRAAGHETSIPLYNSLVTELGKQYDPSKIQTGRFGADMQIELLNNGPVTICMDTKNKE